MLVIVEYNVFHDLRTQRWISRVLFQNGWQLYSVLIKWIGTDHVVTSLPKIHSQVVLQPAASIMDVRQTTNVLKLVFLGLQLAAVVILVLTGIQFQDTKTARDILKSTGDYVNLRDAGRREVILGELNFEYYVLLVAIVVLTIKTPMTFVSFFLSNYILMVFAAIFDMAATFIYIFLLVASILNSRVWLGGAIAGVFINCFSFGFAIVFAKRIRNGQH